MQRPLIIRSGQYEFNLIAEDEFATKIERIQNENPQLLFEILDGFNLIASILFQEPLDDKEAKTELAFINWDKMLLGLICGMIEYMHKVEHEFNFGLTFCDFSTMAQNLFKIDFELIANMSAAEAKESHERVNRDFGFET